MNTKTLQDIYNICYGIIAQGQDSTAYPTTLLLSFISKAQNDICFGNIVNLSTGERLEKQALPFLEENTFFSTYSFSTLAIATAIGNTTIECANTFPSSGTLWINGNIITYTGNTGTLISGIPSTGSGSIRFDHTAGVKIFFIYSLPSDFGQLSRAFLTTNNTMTRRAMIGIDDRDLSSPVPNSYVYNILNANWSSSSYISEAYYTILRGQYFFPLVGQIVSGGSISFEYQMRPAQLTTETDIVTVPDEYSLSTIPYLAISEMMMNRGESEEAIRLQNFAFQNVKTMYQFYNSQRTELQYNVRVRNSSEGYLAI